MSALRTHRLGLTLACILLAGVSSAAIAEGYGFSISVDGEHVAGDKPVRAEPRATDLRLENMDIQVRYDGLEIRPMLNVLTTDLRASYRAGETVAFRLTTNYGAFIERAELLITDRDGRAVAVLPIGADGAIDWTMPADGASDYLYVARVHGAAGRFDETAPLPLRRTDRDTTERIDIAAAGWGEDRASRRSITLTGGAVTVCGTGLAPGAEVAVLGETIPVDTSGRFVVQRILPSGEHSVDINVLPANGNRVSFRRDIVIPDDDWFYVAMADLTVGARSASAMLEPAATGEFTEGYARGRLAFYLKGKIKGEYLLTASGDTGEGPLADMFTGILSKDPQAVLSRINPDDYYPVYGDDSELVNDAPTRGKLYVRLERGDSRVLWGTFRTQIDSGGLYSDNRVLYGAQGVYRSDEVTSSGEARISVDAHAAMPGTFSQRDVLLGTGGSAYFLHQQDVVVDSEVLSVELRDPLTGIVTATRRLVKGTDYRINYLQGLVILATPLTPEAGTGPLAGGEADAQYLVAQYEYAPLDPPVGDYALAGNGRVWLNDHLSLGATAVEEERDGREVSLLGGNVRLQMSDGTYVELEAMRSESTGSTSWTSTDGGLTFVEQAIAGPGAPAMAYRAGAHADLSDIGVDGEVGATLEYREAGFAAPGSTSSLDQLLVSTFAELRPSETVTLRADYARAETPGSIKDSASAEIDYAVTPDITVALGLHHARTSTGMGDTSRTNVGVRLEYEASEDLATYVYGRKTVARQGAIGDDDRIGVGVEYDWSDALSLFGDVSIGTTGPAVEAGIVHQPTPDERNHIGYRLAANPGLGATGEAQSGLVVGSERRINEIATMHSEAIYNIFGPNRTLTQSYGVTLTPDQAWTVQAALGRGEIFDPDAEDFQRTALSLGVGYVDDRITGSVRGEYRNQESELDTRDTHAGLISSSVSWRTSEDWRLLANLDGVYSLSNAGVLQDGNYLKANIGYAYRPVDNERLNALARYTYLYDLPGAGQLSPSGVSPGPAQRSHVFSIDANYDLTEYVTIGGKYGARIGEVSLTRLEEDFIASSAHLGIVRVDIEPLESWEILLEGRAMLIPEIASLEAGGLVAVYRDFGDQLKLGVGYNFTGFSDDLTDLKGDQHGIFFNAIAKY